MHMLFSTQPLFSKRLFSGRYPSVLRCSYSVLLSCVLMFATNSPVSAADAGGNYAIWGVGQTSCHKFVKAREAEDSGKYKDYLMGYLTAFNTLSEDTYNISGKTKLGEIEEWLNGYCDLHQIESFNRAIQQYVADSFESRLSVSPGSSKGWGSKPTK